MGRQAQPKEIKALKKTGNQTRERRRAEPHYPDGGQLATHDEESGEVTIPVAPSELSESARQIWDRNGYQMAVMNLFPNSGYEYLLNYCRLHDVIESSYKEYNGKPTIVNDKGATLPNPALRVYREALTQMLAIGAKFGFTPADKTKISMNSVEGKTKDKNSQKRVGVGG